MSGLKFPLVSASREKNSRSDDALCAYVYVQHIYIYMCVCVCVCVCIYIYIYTNPTCVRACVRALIVKAALSS